MYVITYISVIYGYIRYNMYNVNTIQHIYVCFIIVIY